MLYILQTKEDHFMKRNEKKNEGFTLVELIVVIVILAILAAILVPALLGYIDKAKNQQVVLNAKSCLTAAQAELSSMYASGIVPDGTNMMATNVSGTGDTRGDSILKTADVPSCTKLIIGVTPTTADTIKANDHASYTITYVEYQESGSEDSIKYNATSKSWDSKNAKPAGVKTFTIYGTESTATTQATN
jgi:prepilin-type N-terminal cleavage/methylation domain-containing protein